MNDDVGHEKGLEKLILWRKSADFAVKVCKEILPAFPDHEKYSLTSQLRRAVQSIPANIAEGYGRYYYQYAIRFCYIARGSLEESRSHLTIACELSYLSSDRFQQSVLEMDEIRKMIHGYIAYLKRSKQGELEPGAIKEFQIDYELNLNDE